VTHLDPVEIRTLNLAVNASDVAGGAIAATLQPYGLFLIASASVIFIGEKRRRRMTQRLFEKLI
jgi:hypothetical protein